jgi:hypothetical protein
VAGAWIGRQEPRRRRARALRGGALGGLLLLLAGVEVWAAREWPGARAVALLGHETLLVFVLHLQLLYGGVLASGLLRGFMGRLGFPETAVALALMIPVLYAAAWTWHRLKARAPHEATLVLVLLGTAFVYEFVTRPW